MTSVYLLIVVLFVIYSFKSFDKAFLLFAIIRPVLNAGIAIKYSPPALTVDLLLAFYFISMFYFKRKWYVTPGDKPFFSGPFIFMIITYVVSVIVAVLDGNNSAISAGARLIFTTYVFLFAFWYVCKSEEKIQWFIRAECLLFCVVFIYGLYEFLTNTNPFVEIISSNIPSEFAEGKIAVHDLTDNSRGGRARMQSLFHISIAYGVCSLLFMFFVINVKKLSYYVSNHKYLINILIAGSLIACYLCNSKTAIVAFPIFILSFISSTRNRIILIISLAIIFFFSNEVIALLSNVIDVESLFLSQDDLSHGSNAAMRLNQLEISLAAFWQSPIFGNGLGYSSWFSQTVQGEGLMGAESAWFKYLVENGAMGVLAFVYLILSFSVAGRILGTEENLKLMFYSLGFFVIVSITDVGYGQFYILYIAMYRLFQLNKNNYDTIDINNYRSRSKI